MKAGYAFLSSIKNVLTLTGISCDADIKAELGTTASQFGDVSTDKENKKTSTTGEHSH